MGLAIFKMISVVSIYNKDLIIVRVFGDAEGSTFTFRWTLCSLVRREVFGRWTVVPFDGRTFYRRVLLRDSWVKKLKLIHHIQHLQHYMDRD